MFKKVNTIATLLLVIGGLNWGLVGFFDFNFVEYFTCQEWLVTLLYVFIGFAALFWAIAWKEIQKMNKS
ncbi:MAG: DUF378 domain-containing protein [Simkaniaceae bacterium]